MKCCCNSHKDHHDHTGFGASLFITPLSQLCSQISLKSFFFFVYLYGLPSTGRDFTMKFCWAWRTGSYHLPKQWHCHWLQWKLDCSSSPQERKSLPKEEQHLCITAEQLAGAGNTARPISPWRRAVSLYMSLYCKWERWKTSGSVFLKHFSSHLQTQFLLLPWVLQKQYLSMQSCEGVMYDGIFARREMYNLRKWLVERLKSRKEPFNTRFLMFYKPNNFSVVVHNICSQAKEL